MVPRTAPVARRSRSKQRYYRRVHVFAKRVEDQLRREEEAKARSVMLDALDDKMARRIAAAMRGCQGA